MYYKSCACGLASTTETFTSGDPLGHAFETAWSSNETSHYHVCTVCGAKADEAAHTWNVEAATEETDKHCTVCGYVAEAKLDHVHKGTLVPGTAASCTAPGVKAYYTCTCGQAFEDENCIKQITNLDEWKVIPQLPHTGGEATCTSKAVCEVCGTQYGEKDPGNHKNVKLEGYLPATTTHAGYTGDRICQDCRTVLEQGKVIPKKSISQVKPEEPIEEPEEQPEASYSDVKPTDWYAEAVSYVTEQGIMTGVGSGQFSPDTSVTRAMVWTVLARMAGEDTDGGATWYAKAQSWSMETGVSDGTSPTGSITREQLAAMLYRFEGSPAVSSNLDAYPDADEVSDWAVDAMVWATEEGIINGIGGKLSPKTGATRAQLATMLMRFTA